MSWKSVELQVALPRVQDAGREQDLISKQNQRFQETLTQSQLQEELRKRNQVNKFEELRKMDLKDNNEKRSQDEHHQNNKSTKNKEDQDQALIHPYLGSNIDFNG